MLKSPDPHVFIVFGGTGDLMRRKLLPALHSLARQGEIGKRFKVLAVARDEMTDSAYRDWALKALEEFACEVAGSDENSTWCNSCLHYQTIGKADQAAFEAVRDRIVALEKEADIPENRIFYLALPPSVFPGTISGLGEVGLNLSEGWTRLVVEKPFGRDLHSAHELNSLLHTYYDEKQVYRIDHYLGKETVQNLLVFRFANPIFENLWNRVHISSVQISVGETVGVGSRAGYYDRAGALRDMVQNHLSQLLTLIAMEAPSAFSADAIRDEKVKVLQSVAPIKSNGVVFAQYADGNVGGEAVPGYLQEDGVAPNSSTETFVALRLEIANWRWQGVPFYLRTGKRLKKRLTQVVINFKKPPVSLFEPFDDCNINANRLALTLQPDEGFDLGFEVKRPGQGMSLKTESLKFQYADEFSQLPDGYETLLHDVMTSDQTLFVRADEVESSWRLYEPLLSGSVGVTNYEAGTWGPQEADRLLAQNGDWWAKL